jgi:hypothetical protein
MHPSALTRLVTLLCCSVFSAPGVIIGVLALSVDPSGERATVLAVTLLALAAHFAAAIVWVRNGAVGFKLLIVSSGFAIAALAVWGVIALVFAGPSFGLMLFMGIKSLKSQLFEMIDDGRL